MCELIWLLLRTWSSWNIIFDICFSFFTATFDFGSSRDVGTVKVEFVLFKHSEEGNKNLNESYPILSQKRMEVAVISSPFSVLFGRLLNIDCQTQGYKNSLSIIIITISEIILPSNTGSIIRIHFGDPIWIGNDDISAPAFGCRLGNIYQL